MMTSKHVKHGQKCLSFGIYESKRLNPPQKNTQTIRHLFTEGQRLMQVAFNFSTCPLNQERPVSISVELCVSNVDGKQWYPILMLRGNIETMCF